MKDKPELHEQMAILMQSMVPLVVLRGQTLVYANQAAYHSLGLDPSHSVVGMDGFRFVHPSEHEMVRASLTELLTNKRSVTGVPRLLIDASGSTVQVVGAVTPVEWEGALAAAITYMVLREQSDQDSKDGAAGSSRPPAPAINLGSLSPRERQVALLVAQGFSVQNIAALLRIRRETVRTHIKAVYRKTRTHTRVELTRLMLGLPGAGAAERYPAQPARGGIAPRVS